MPKQVSADLIENYLASGPQRLPPFIANVADNTPTDHAAWLAVPGACLCAPIFTANFNHRV
jgi:hypothetical protein